MFAFKMMASLCLSVFFFSNDCLEFCFLDFSLSIFVASSFGVMHRDTTLILSGVGMDVSNLSKILFKNNI